MKQIEKIWLCSKKHNFFLDSLSRNVVWILWRWWKDKLHSKHKPSFSFFSFFLITICHNRWICPSLYILFGSVYQHYKYTAFTFMKKFRSFFFVIGSSDLIFLGHAKWIWDEGGKNFAGNIYSVSKLSYLYFHFSSVWHRH